MGWLGGTPTKAPTTPRGKRGRSLRDHESPAKYEFMHFVLEYGEKTLANCLREVDLAQYREILWQVLYALHVAGKTFSFSHYDLHHKNILLCSLPMEDGCYVYYHKGVAYYNQTCIVKIADFGLSRITTEEGETLCNTKNALGQEYSPDVDVMSVVGWPWKNLDPDRDNDPNHKELQSLQRLMRKGVRPAALLNHPFFAPLKEAPAAFSAERCVAVSTEGLEGIPKDLHARALATCAPPTPSASRSGASGSTASPTTRSPSGFVVPASPYRMVGPSGIRRSFVKPPQPFTPSFTAKLADHEEPADLKEGEPTPKRARPTTPTSYPTTPTSQPTTPRSSVEASKPEGTPSQPAAEVRKVIRLAKRKRPPPPSFLAADSGANKENDPNRRSEYTNNKNNETTKKAKREADAQLAADESDARDMTLRARRSGRAKKTVSVFSPSAKPKVALSSRRKAVTR
ncbi:non-specific serine/threonine protein kinase [Acanthamoeba castellanii str. Neff]|uniref:Non-specific serine/threonine protein kinase n=1 Tax=Acanthamoeba castellanii (strain ATCC 30010 / Neff) TaxID=1257118 RepID=L8GK79_ACACF|nr:non-specific serine/threonine protein kinase [Acanthamoeba castellanii str. Neff]ELR13108.1 non-specific serine/threonine protein kinase [Acanthamoeba castellanii str. Neff]